MDLLKGSKNIQKNYIKGMIFWNKTTFFTKKKELFPTYIKYACAMDFAPILAYRLLQLAPFLHQEWRGVRQIALY